MVSLRRVEPYSRDGRMGIRANGEGERIPPLLRIRKNINAGKKILSNRIPEP